MVGTMLLLSWRLQIDGGNPLLRKNMIYLGCFHGCLVTGKSSARIERNDFFQNQVGRGRKSIPYRRQ